jgi:hypothetical protein
VRRLRAATLRHLACAASLASAVGCNAEDPSDVPPPDAGKTFDYPLDDTMRFHHLQALSTHNSYHVESEGSTLPDWDYTHAPLAEQLELQGVRHFELDVRLDADLGAFTVYHLPVVDEQTTCFLFADCLSAIRTWSDAHPAHQPLTVQLELKDPIPGDVETYFDALHREIAAAWPSERIVTPDVVMGEHASLGDAVRIDGWPTLGALRGKVMFTLDDAGDFRAAYTYGLTSLAGRTLFAHAAPSDPFAAIAVLNEPFESDAIALAVGANMLVRTRADADGVEALAGDTTRRDAALASGAHFVSTDHPVAMENGYVVEIPGGTPSRCNPVTTPHPGIPSEAIEDPAFMH